MKEQLINAVFKSTALWDKRHKNHHNRFVLEKEWKKIADELGSTVKAVKKIWKNLRQEFGKQLQKIIKSGDGAPEELHNDWPYFSQMLFLKDQFSTRKSYGNMKVGEGVDLRALVDDSDSTEQSDSFLERMRGFSTQREASARNPVSPESVENCVYVDDQASPSSLRDVPNASSEEMITKTGYRKRITPQSEIGQKLLLLEKEKFCYRKRKDEEATNPNDEDLGFFNSLIPHVKKLQPRDKLLFRMKVQKILFEMVYPVTAASNTNTAQAWVPGQSDFQYGTAYSQQGPTYTQLQPPQYGISPFRATDTDPLYGPSAITASTYTGPLIQNETVPQLDNSPQYQS